MLGGGGGCSWEWQDVQCALRSGGVCGQDMDKTQDHRNRIEKWLVVGSGWRLAVGGGWRLVAVGGWQLTVGRGRRLAVGSPWQLSLGAVLNKEKSS